MRSLDRVIVLKFLGTEALGFYGLAVMAVGFLLTMPDAIAYVLYPQLLRRVREGGDRAEAIREPAHRAMRALSLIVPALCALAYLAADDAVVWLLPSFDVGVPALRILCFSAAGLSLANLGSVVQMALGRQMVLVPVAVGMTVVGVVLDLIAVQSGHGVRGVAWATFFTYALNSAILIGLADKAMGGPWRTRIIFLVRLFIPLAVAIPLAYLFERFLPGYGAPGPMRLLRLVASPTVIAIGKLLFNLVFLAVIEAVTVPLYLVLMGAPPPRWGSFLVLLGLGSLALACATTLVGAVIAQTRGRGALFAGVALPLLLPVLAAAVSGMRSQWAGGPVLAEARMLGAYAVALFGVSLLLYDHLWED